MLTHLARACPWGSMVALAIAVGATPGRAQTVVPPETPFSAKADSAARTSADTARARTDTAAKTATRTDTAAKPVAAPAPAAPTPAAIAAAAAAAGIPKGVCDDPSALGPGRASTDVLLVTFRRSSTPEQRESVIKAARGVILAPDPTDDASAYVRMPSGGNEFALRAIADRLIRAPIVREVGPAQCPTGP